MALLNDVYVDGFFRDENDSHAILLKKEKNLKMGELLASQVECKIK